MPITSTGTGPAVRLTSPPTRSNGVRISVGIGHDAELGKPLAENGWSRTESNLTRRRPQVQRREVGDQLDRARKKAGPFPDRAVEIKRKAAQVRAATARSSLADRCSIRLSVSITSAVGRHCRQKSLPS